MNARPLLEHVAAVLGANRLEAILIGMGAAALHGAPVTTVDLDFFFRDTPLNRRKLKAVARALRASILRPYYPVSNLFRVVRDEDGLQLDFLPTAHGIRSFESLRSRATRVALGPATVLVADLRDVMRHSRRSSSSTPTDSVAARCPDGQRCDKSASPRPRRSANSRRRAALRALRAETELALREQIRRILALPMAERTHFLRVRLPGGGSAV